MGIGHCLSVDVGASSGRIMLGTVEDGRIRLEEMHRFANGTVQRNGSVVWNIGAVFAEIVTGLKKCADADKKPSSLAIDTWGVDFALLDAEGELVGEVVSYRDPRTEGMREKVYETIGEKDLYARTGIHGYMYNSLFQLYALKATTPERLKHAATFLMIPDYLGFLLTGKMASEYTNATTTQLINAVTGTWDWELVDILGLPRDIFLPPRRPGTPLGTLRPEIRQAVSYDVEVVLPCSHDTASAILALPGASADTVYLNSGTWSLIGVERENPDCGEASREAGFSSEGGYGGRYCFLKNIMGMWILQGIRSELGGDIGFAEQTALAESGLRFEPMFDVENWALLDPDSMTEAIRRQYAASGQRPPETPAELFGAAYNSLAESYAKAVAVVERLTGRTYGSVHIMGGGSQDALLNRLTANRTGKTVHAGPVEATAIGNILAQTLRTGMFSGLEAAREAVRRSFPITTTRPE